MDDSGASLRQLFGSARGKQEELDGLDPRTDTYSENLRSSISAFEECRHLINKMGVFSPNEEVEDISTNDLQWASPQTCP